jgi:cytochrome c
MSSGDTDTPAIVFAFANFRRLNGPVLVGTALEQGGNVKTLPLILATAIASAIPEPASAQDVEAGRMVFNKCRPCHQIGEGAKNLVGPELNGLIGRKAGGVEGYSYSEANKNSGITWDETTFKEYIKNPKRKIPNTKMVFAGISDEKDIENLVAFLKQYGPDDKIKN